MITNFDLYRWKKAGMTNLGVNKLLKFFHRYDKKISLRQMGQVAQLKSIPNFIEQYKNQDVSKLREEYKIYPSFSLLDEIYPERLKEIYNPLVNIEKRVCPLEGAYPWFLLILSDIRKLFIAESFPHAYFFRNKATDSA